MLHGVFVVRVSKQAGFGITLRPTQKVQAGKRACEGNDNGGDREDACNENAKAATATTTITANVRTYMM